MTVLDLDNGESTVRLFFNYVGCKWKYLNLVKPSCYLLFFNYVGCKCYIPLSCPAASSCCSLTMWDVNLSPWRSEAEKLVTLFFNYVGCKCILKNLMMKSWPSCSLTMWDVNGSFFSSSIILFRLFFNYVGCKCINYIFTYIGISVVL